MAEPATKLSVKTEEGKAGPSTREWHPLESLRREVDRLFEDFDGGFWRRPRGRSLFEIPPIFRGETSWGTAPAVDFVEKDKHYEVTAELPGLDEKNIEVTVANGMLTIKGEKKEEKEEKKKDYYLSEPNAASDPSSARSACLKASTPTASRPASGRAC
jgi:HSP20 family protein